MIILVGLYQIYLRGSKQVSKPILTYLFDNTTKLILLHAPLSFSLSLSLSLSLSPKIPFHITTYYMPDAFDASKQASSA